MRSIKKPPDGAASCYYLVVWSTKERPVETCESSIIFVKGLTAFELGMFIGSLNSQKVYVLFRSHFPLYGS
jgi:hypothetical protein